MKTTHTPGPWSFRRVHCIEDRPATALMLETQAPNRPLNDPVIMAVRENWIYWLLNTPRGRADAALIASAPDLYAIVRAEYDAHGGFKTLPIGYPAERAAAILAAIAKAEGGAK